MEIWRLSKEDVSRQLDDALADRDDLATLAAVERLSGSWHFAQMVDRWGPGLYRRNRDNFLGFLETRVQAYNAHATRAWEGWIDEVEQAGDMRLFSRLYAAKIMSLGLDTWHRDLERAWTGATTAERRAGLEKYALAQGMAPMDLCVRFYQEDAEAVRPWLLEAAGREEDPGCLDPLIEAATAAGDIDFADALFARNLDFEAWETRTRHLAQTIRDPEDLGRAMDRILPVRGRSFWALFDYFGGLPEVITDLARQRQDMAVWLRRRRARLGFAGSWTDLATLAFGRRDQPEWFALWIALSRGSTGPEGFNGAVLKATTELDGPAAITALMSLGGAVEVWEEEQFQRPSEPRFWSLDAKSFNAALGLSSGLLLGPLRPHVRFPTIDGKIFARVVATGHEPVIDLVTSRFMTAYPGWGPHKGAAGKILEYWRELLERDPESFVRRALRVTGFLQPMSAYWRHGSGKTHPIRLFFLDPKLPWLEVDGAARDLLESSAFSVRQLALQTLLHRAQAAPDDARTQATACQDILIGQLFQEQASRELRLVLFALGLTTTDELTASAVARGVRDALVLHQGDEGSLRARDLLGTFLAKLLQDWPALRRPTERPVIFRRAPRAEGAA
jgi:hypothetical protein